MPWTRCKLTDERIGWGYFEQCLCRSVTECCLKVGGKDGQQQQPCSDNGNPAQQAQAPEGDKAP